MLLLARAYVAQHKVAAYMLSCCCTLPGSGIDLTHTYSHTHACMVISRDSEKLKGILMCTQIDSLRLTHAVQKETGRLPVS